MQLEWSDLEKLNSILLFFSCIYMTGLIWVIQLVHYPAYHFIDKQKFLAYQAFHTQKITYIVGPAMVFELFSSLIFVFYQQWSLFSLLQMILLIGIWLVTALWSVPLHSQLMTGYDAVIVQRLLRSNWIRTIAWSIRSLLCAGFVLSQ